MLYYCNALIKPSDYHFRHLDGERPIRTHKCSFCNPKCNIFGVGEWSHFRTSKYMLKKKVFLFNLSSQFTPFFFPQTRSSHFTLDWNLDRWHGYMFSLFILTLYTAFDMNYCFPLWGASTGIFNYLPSVTHLCLLAMNLECCYAFYCVYLFH